MKVLTITTETRAYSEDEAKAIINKFRENAATKVISLRLLVILTRPRKRKAKL